MRRHKFGFYSDRNDIYILDDFGDCITVSDDSFDNMIQFYLQRA